MDVKKSASQVLNFSMDVKKSATLEPYGLFGSEANMKRFYEEFDRCFRWLWIIVEGYDTSLPPDEIKKALTHHFSSCGKIDRVIVEDRCAHVEVFGEHLEEKTSELDGSDLGGFKLVVKPFPRLVYQDAPFGSQPVKMTEE